MPLVLSVLDDEEIIVTHGGETLVIKTRRDTRRNKTKVLCNGPQSFRIVRKEVLERKGTV